MAVSFQCFFFLGSKKKKSIVHLSASITIVPKTRSSFEDAQIAWLRILKQNRFKLREKERVGD